MMEVEIKILRWQLWNARSCQTLGKYSTLLPLVCKGYILRPLVDA